MAKCEIETIGRDMFVIYDGKLIARRGRPKSPQAKTWISLEPGFAVYDTPDGIVVEHNNEVTVQ